MLTDSQARKLQIEMRRELQGEPASLWKCAAGLLALVIIGLLGAVQVTERDMAGETAAVARAPTLR